MEDQNNKNNTGNDSGKTADGSDAVMQKLADIEKRIDSGQKASKEELDLIASLMADEDDSDVTSGKDKADKSSSAPDFNNMTNADLVSHVVGALREELSGLKAEIDKKISQSQQALEDERVEREVKEAAAKYGQDFKDEWDNTIKTLQKYPSLSVEEGYLLTKSPKLMDQLRKKAEEQDAKAKASASMSSSGSIDTNALLEGVKGESHKDVAYEIAKKLGL